MYFACVTKGFVTTGIFKYSHVTHFEAYRTMGHIECNTFSSYSLIWNIFQVCIRRKCHNDVYRSDWHIFIIFTTMEYISVLYLNKFLVLHRLRVEIELHNQIWWKQIRENKQIWWKQIRENVRLNYAIHCLLLVENSLTSNQLSKNDENKSFLLIENPMTSNQLEIWWKQFFFCLLRILWPVINQKKEAGLYWNHQETLPMILYNAQLIYCISAIKLTIHRSSIPISIHAKRESLQ